MKTRPLLLLCLLLFGCTSHEDDFISKYCPGSCTVIQGRLTTDNGTRPLAGVKLNVYWRSHQAYLQFGYTERRKAVATTDENGAYELRFLLRDDELNTFNQIQNGSIRIAPVLDKTKYFICRGDKIIFYNDELTRDTTLTLNYTLPQVAYLDIKPQNRQAMKSGDYLDIHLSVKSGENNNHVCNTGYSFNAAGGVHEPVAVAALQPITVTVKKIKDGLTTETKETITLTPGERLVYQPTF